MIPKENNSRCYTTTITNAQSHIALQVSQRSRKLVLSKGYCPWKFETPKGHFEIIYWNPDVDTITFPPYPDTAPSEEKRPPGMRMTHFVHLYPEEAAMAKNIAIPTTSMRHREPSGWRSMRSIMDNFPAMRNLVMIVDEVEERKIVTSLIKHHQLATKFGVWNILRDIEEDCSRMDPWLPRKVFHKDKVPKLRVVGCVDGILTGQSLNISLRCNPCEYLGMG
jgi:hypothetical protein